MRSRDRGAECGRDALNQVWSWVITYLPGAVRGQFFYLHPLGDVFSRKIVGSAGHDHESATLAAVLVCELCLADGVARQPLVLHADKVAPTKGATMLATLQQLGIAPSFSRPSVSNDNPFSEALFRALNPLRAWWASVTGYQAVSPAWPVGRARRSNLSMLLESRFRDGDPSAA